jgi:DNA polymerase III alpha subunit
MKKLIGKVKFYFYVTLVTAGLSGLVGCSLYVGYNQGVKDNTKKFHTFLIEKDFAEYNNKTGVWQLRNLIDMVPNLDNSILFGESDLPTKKVAKR